TGARSRPRARRPRDRADRGAAGGRTPASRPALRGAPAAPADARPLCPCSGTGTPAAALGASDRARDGRAAGGRIGLPGIPVVPSGAHGPPRRGRIRRLAGTLACDRAVL